MTDDRHLHFGEQLTHVEAAGNGIRSDVAVLGIEHRQLRFLGRADASFRVQHEDTRVRHAVKGMRDRAAGVAGRCRQDRQRLVARVERRHEPRHRARTDILERQGRSVEQLERKDPRLDLNQRDRKIQRLDDSGFECGRVELAARIRPQHPVGDLSQRACGQPLDLALRPLIDRLRHVQPAAGREPLDQSLAQRNGSRRAAGIYKAHVESTRAPIGAIGET